MALPGVEQLRIDFNVLSERPRLLLVVSPTCDDCLAGVDVVHGSLGEFASSQIVPLVLWVLMREGDTEMAAVTASRRFTAARHFWEEEGWPVSSALRPILGLGHYDPQYSAWDVYLFFRPGVIWETGAAPPAPDSWAHNLREDPGVGTPLNAATVRSWLSGRG